VYRWSTPSRGVMTRVESWPSGLSVGPVATRAEKPYVSGRRIQGWSSNTEVEAMATTPAATIRADVSFTGFGKRRRSELNIGKGAFLSSVEAGRPQVVGQRVIWSTPTRRPVGGGHRIAASSICHLLFLPQLDQILIFRTIIPIVLVMFRARLGLVGRTFGQSKPSFGHLRPRERTEDQNDARHWRRCP
jgi:hypothetical protein